MIQEEQGLELSLRPPGSGNWLDIFAGGGGASTGIEEATGHAPKWAINDCPAAIEMHEVNHTNTIHYCRSVMEVWPHEVDPHDDIEGLWASPDCTHFSRALGAVPREKKIRALAWIVATWAQARKPRYLFVENVPEFVTWGPLDESGHPIKARQGETFKQWLNQLDNAGYNMDYRVLNAADYGAPTARKRLFVIGRNDGQPNVWPDPTHGRGRAEPHVPAATCIDWDKPCPSIFLTPEEVKRQGLRVRRPLAEATQRRIAAGVVKYVLNNPRPFLLCLTHGGRLEPVDEPFRTITTANRGERALVVPSLIRYNGEQEGRNLHVHDLNDPLPTVPTENRFGLVAPLFINTRNGERIGQDPRVRDVLDPYFTVTGQGSQGAMVAAFLARHNGTTEGKYDAGRDLDDPAGTITSRDTHGLVGVWMEKFFGTARHGQDIRHPAPTLLAGGGHHAGLCAAFLIRYYGQGGQLGDLKAPAHTLTTLARLGLVVVHIGGEPWVLTDIGIRMLDPEELLRIQYGVRLAARTRLTGTKSQQIERIGNSVPPLLVEAVIRAQLGTWPRGAR